MNLKINQMTKIALCTTIMVVCTFITIPFSLIPFTLQTLAVFLILLLLGGKNGTISIALYIILGIIGLPVFAGMKGGIAVLFGPTGGYIVGFILQGLLFWLLEKYNQKILIINLILGLLICYLFGTLWFVFVYPSPMTFMQALSICVTPYIIPDLLKLSVALIISKKIKTKI